ncbi:unnamed protein product [Didymodactylos carnosus]|uniref:Splicing factor 3B subunit 3 n=1 Tax=Didymodactylos carnosus TaxID=1234261 RepID=A0A813RY61_9BILA|nr:unnamed protein product [Didymodactylos carnosus]CAF0788510.1 unnamed protein product [Didymodactylos carnosus]CAF3547577.1 unnamed protein product [Didymodactylos carnosus]CAF3572563.1 unnamed protein product [Didymodactylos carnosus]
MYLYNLTLQRPNGITHCIHGNFSGPKQQEICVSRGKVLEILKPDPSTGKVYTLLTVEVFGVIRSLVPIRLTGSNRDYIVIGSDSGRILILEYNASKNTLEKVHQETFGKSGCRRIVPGQFLAVDPKGRALMIGAVEKQKLVYILNRDSQARLTISSPLEAHKANTITFHTVGVDVGFENPIFACLEVDYEEVDNDPTGQALKDVKQTLTFYELDLGLNHVVRKYSEHLDEFANLLITVPGGNEGPSGVLICSENYLTFKNFGDQPDIRCPIPKRRSDLDDPERSIIFVSSATHKTKNMFFFLVQTEQGDLFKVTLNHDPDMGMVTEIRLKYFDTVPVASAMCVLRTGFLFVASEFGNHYLYQVSNLGDDEEPEFSSSERLEEGDTFFFVPRKLKNLILVDEMDSLSPIMACHIADLANEDTPQLYVACGRGPRSSLRILRHGLEVTEMAVSELPGNPNAVWTVKRRADDDFDAYIIVSFINATLVLSIGETVEEVTDSGFLGTTPTLSCSQLGEDALVQIYREGIRHIRADKRVNEWRAPGKRTITQCVVNQRQVVIALTGGELVYFEMDSTGQLNEYTERKEMTGEVVCMGLGSVPENEQRSRFLAVGLSDSTVRIISLDPQDCLTRLSMQALPAPAESLCIVEMKTTEGIVVDASGGRDPQTRSIGTSYLNIGLQNGVLLRSVLDSVTGDMSDTRTRYLGSRPVKLFRISMQNNEAVLAMSSRTWLSYTYQGRFHLTPLSYESLEYAAGFASEQCPEGIVAISGNTLRILTLEKLGVIFNQEVRPLKYTPRRFVLHPETNIIYLIETDHVCYTELTKQHRREQMAKEMVDAADEDDKELASEMAAAVLSEKLPEEIFGTPKGAIGMWASQLRVMDPISGETKFVHEFEQNESAQSLMRFEARPADTFLLIGVAKDLVLNPRSHLGGVIYCFLVLENGERLHFIHRTVIDEVPGAICPLAGRALISVGASLRVYEIGKKKLLKKCENKNVPNHIITLHTMGHRVFATDVQESVHFIRYKKMENQLIVFADDTSPRFSVASCLLDYSTVCVTDKFGNITVLRLPADANDEVDIDPTGSKGLWDRGLLNGASNKCDVLSQFHIGEIVTSVQRATLIPGGSESLVYTTISGTIGALLPFSSHEDHDFFQHLEMHMRSEYQTLCGRDQSAFRSYYLPVKHVIDGDLCEQYSNLDMAKQKLIADGLDRTPSEVSKKLEDLRTRYAF